MDVEAPRVIRQGRAPQARSQNRFQASEIGCASINGADEEGVGNA
jgi:hypothetical protein